MGRSTLASSFFVSVLPIGSVDDVINAQNTIVVSIAAITHTYLVLYPVEQSLSILPVVCPLSLPLHPPPNVECVLTSAPTCDRPSSPDLKVPAHGAD